MVQSKGWDWENANQSAWLKPTEDSYYLSQVWKEKGYSKLLDLGTGLGRHAVHFAKNGFDVSAVDISDYGIRHLISWAENEKLPIKAVTGDMLHLPSPDKEFDCVFAYHVVSHSVTPGEQMIISEIERVLKRDGEIFLSFCSKESIDFQEAQGDRIDGNTVIYQKEPEVGVPHFYADLADIIKLLHNFSITKVRHTEYCSLDLHNRHKRMYYYVNAVYSPIGR